MTDTLASDQKTEQGLRGEILYGNDLSDQEIEDWFEDECEEYFSLYYGATHNSHENLSYEYKGSAEEHCFK